MKARSIARELALLGISQIPDTRASSSRKDRAGQIPLERIHPSRGQARRASSQAAAQVDAEQIDTETSLHERTERRNALLMKAMTTLGADAQEAMEAAEGELQRSERLILESETRTTESAEVRSRIQPAIPLIETAINRVGDTLELLMFAQQGKRKGMVAAKNALETAAKSAEAADLMMAQHEEKILDVAEVRSQIQTAITLSKEAIDSLKETLKPENLTKLISQEEIRSYAIDLLDNWISHWQDIDTQLDDAMEKWNIRRLARVDRDILRLAMMEIIHMDVPKRVAIDEAIEMAKRYSDEDGYRFINGVLRRATDRLKAQGTGEAIAQEPEPDPDETDSEE
ncbi:MAG: transcription antitermination factor NusB [Cyanobacteria bacterium J06649_4]